MDRYGWLNDLTDNTRLRKVDGETLRDGFVFTRRQDSWECVIPNGSWKVHACLGDSAHPQPGQYLLIEGNRVATNIETSAGQFREIECEVNVQDGRLTLTLGNPKGGSNTCINWLCFYPVR